jgi:hypothetical protein
VRLIAEMEIPPTNQDLEEIKRERRRERWKAFFTPIIALGSIVVSVGLLMFFIRACQERFPEGVPTKQPWERRPAGVLLVPHR